ncbi:hypothetical protein [uncultured Methanobrevibacter sp.]|uniref:hypothetical protein n=1 Tax=uncultured Methanobrevibacter sp. TaxID=253161 RepID=UPI0025F27AB6|nr:hypothetical protein [uncultured Methanobrevibacter sp.]
MENVDKMENKLEGTEGISSLAVSTLFQKHEYKPPETIYFHYYYWSDCDTDIYVGPPPYKRSDASYEAVNAVTHEQIINWFIEKHGILFQAVPYYDEDKKLKWGCQKIKLEYKESNIIEYEWITTDMPDRWHALDDALYIYLTKK